MKRNSATMKSAVAQRLTLPASADCAPELIAAKIEAVLTPPRPDTMASRFREPCISRRTSERKDILQCRPLRSLPARQLRRKQSLALSIATAPNHSADGDAKRRAVMVRSVAAR